CGIAGIRHYTAAIRIQFWESGVRLGQSDNQPEPMFIALPVLAQFVKVKAKNFGKLPDWHMGEIEAQAQAATERMGIPMVLLFVAFIALIGYPAVHLVLGSF
ncbi:MAG: type II secretion protein F, partial [Actinobacteria bacterium]|nr:type II secretion protein F [Actinomycetota bacterium]